MNIKILYEAVKSVYNKPLINEEQHLMNEDDKSDKYSDEAYKHEKISEDHVAKSKIPNANPKYLNYHIKKAKLHREISDAFKRLVAHMDKHGE